MVSNLYGLQTLNTRQAEGRLSMGGSSMEWLAMNEGVDALKQLLWLEQITVYPFVGTMLRQVRCCYSLWLCLEVCSQRKWSAELFPERTAGRHVPR